MIERESRGPRVVIQSKEERKTIVGGIIRSTVLLRGDSDPMTVYSYAGLLPTQFETQAVTIGARQQLLTDRIMVQIFKDAGLADIKARLEAQGKQLAAAIKKGLYKETKGPFSPLVEQFALKELFEEAEQASVFEA
jgi:hypothetical protein